jgi:hypothetical protein
LSCDFFKIIKNDSRIVYLKTIEEACHYYEGGNLYWLPAFVVMEFRLAPIAVKLRSAFSLPLALANGLQWIKKEGFSQNPFQLG